LVYDLWQVRKRNKIRVALLPHLQHSCPGWFTV
jgi:hypothetical protein